MQDIKETKMDKEIRNKNEQVLLLTNDIKEKLIDLPEVLEFIENLWEQFKEMTNKLGKSQSVKDAMVQTDLVITRESICDCKKDIEVCLERPMKSLAEDIKDAAEQAVQNSGFVYEETSGLYYDYNTGYYYNAEFGLYYDGTNGTYLKYNQDTQSYEYHSQVATVSKDPQDDLTLKKDASKRKRMIYKKTKAGGRKKKNVDIEEGECSDTSSMELLSSCGEDDADSDSSEMMKKWPPCMRIIVEETSIPKLKIGSLHIVTYEGGSIGREGNHSVLIPDVNISKHHLNISFDKESNTFKGVDMGSRNGTILNGCRMSPSKQESEPLDIVHGSKIQLGSTVLLCHIHDGAQTCGHCEPGLIANNEAKTVQKISKVTKSESHRKELQNLKKKFGMKSFIEDSPNLAAGYMDRAQKRRDTIGSQNPHEKTQAASVEESITSQNMGFKLLTKMGWKKGQSLGKEGQGILEPINMVSNEGTSGIGCSTTLPEINVDLKAKPDKPCKKNIWRKAQERFDKLPEAHNAFEDSD